ATFETRVDTTVALMPHIPPGPTVVSESGFFSGDDVRRVIEAGAPAGLGGEGVGEAADVGAKIRERRLARPPWRSAASPTSKTRGWPCRRAPTRSASSSSKRLHVS